MILCCVCATLHPDTMQALSPLATDGDVVDLVFSPTVGGSPRGFMHGLMGKQGASYDQVIEGAELYKKFSIFILDSNAVFAHNVFAVCVISSNLGIRVTHENFHVSFGCLVHSGLDFLVKIILLLDGCHIGRVIVLSDVNFSALQTEACCEDLW